MLHNNTKTLYEIYTFNCNIKKVRATQKNEE